MCWKIKPWFPKQIYSRGFPNKTFFLPSWLVSEKTNISNLKLEVSDSTEKIYTRKNRMKFLRRNLEVEHFEKLKKRIELFLFRVNFVPGPKNRELGIWILNGSSSMIQSEKLYSAFASFHRVLYLHTKQLIIFKNSQFY